MDFIEAVFHIAPDGGSGLTELTILLVCLFVPFCILRLRRARRAYLSKRP